MFHGKFFTTRAPFFSQRGWKLEKNNGDFMERHQVQRSVVHYIYFHQTKREWVVQDHPFGEQKLYQLQE